MKRKMKTVSLIVLTALLILIFSPGLQETASAVNLAKAGEEAPFYYTVETGDCLWSVARKFDVEVNTLAETNSLSPESGIQAEERLLIPAGSQFGQSAISWVSGFKRWPLRGQITSVFGWRHGRMHEGLDIAAEPGQPIRAVDSGRVVFAGNRGTYGKTVIINHGGGVRSLYAHSSELDVVPGDYVEQGQIVARVGSTGHSTGPHLHLEVLYRGNPLDPQEYLPGRSAEW